MSAVTPWRLGCHWPEGRVHVARELPAARALPMAHARGAQPRLAGNNTVWPTCVQTGCGNDLQTFMARMPNPQPAMFEPIPLVTIRDAYRAVNGVDPATPNAPGTDPLAQFAWLKHNPFHGFVLESWTPIGTDDHSIRVAIDEVGRADIVVRVHEDQFGGAPWGESSAPIAGLHFVCVDSFRQTTVDGTSWGDEQLILPPYFRHDVVAAYTLQWAKA